MHVVAVVNEEMQLPPSFRYYLVSVIIIYFPNYKKKTFERE